MEPLDKYSVSMELLGAEGGQLRPMKSQFASLGSFRRSVGPRGKHNETHSLYMYVHLCMYIYIHTYRYICACVDDRCRCT